MRLGAGLFLLALGAILKFAVADQHTHGFDVGVIGIILMVVGAIGLLAELVAMAARRRKTYVVRHEGGYAEPPAYQQPRY